MATFRQEQIDDILNYDRAMNRIVLDNEIGQAARFNDERNPPTNRDIKFEALLGTLIDDLKAKIAEALQSVASKQYPKTDSTKVTTLLGLPTGEKKADFKNMNYAAIKKAQKQQEDHNYAIAKVKEAERRGQTVDEEADEDDEAADAAAGTDGVAPVTDQDIVPVPRNLLTSMPPVKRGKIKGDGMPNRKRKFRLIGGNPEEGTRDGDALEKSKIQAVNATENILYDIINKYNGIVDKLLQATQPDGRFSSKRTVSASSISYFSDVLKGLLEPLKHLVFELSQVHNPDLASVINMMTSMVDVIDVSPPFQKVNVLAYKSGMPDFQGLTSSTQLVNVEGYIADLTKYKQRMDEMYNQLEQQSSAMFFNIPSEKLRNSLRQSIEAKSKQYKKVSKDIEEEIKQVRARAKITEDFEANAILIKQAEAAYEGLEEILVNGEPERKELADTMVEPPSEIIKLSDESYEDFLERLRSERERLMDRMEEIRQFQEKTEGADEDEELIDLINKTTRQINHLDEDIQIYSDAVRNNEAVKDFDVFADRQMSKQAREILRQHPEGKRSKQRVQRGMTEADLESRQREAAEAKAKEDAAKKIAAEKAERDAKEAKRKARVAKEKEVASQKTAERLYALEKRSQENKQKYENVMKQLDEVTKDLNYYGFHALLKRERQGMTQDFPLEGRKNPSVLLEPFKEFLKKKYAVPNTGSGRSGGSGGLADYLSTKAQPQYWHHRELSNDDKIHKQVVEQNQKWQRLSNPPHTTPIGNLIPFYRKEEASMYSFPLKLKNENAKLHPDDTQKDARGADVSLLQGPIDQPPSQGPKRVAKKPTVTHRTAKEATDNILQGKGMDRGIGMGKPKKNPKALHKILFDDEDNDMFDEKKTGEGMCGGMIEEESPEEEDRFRNKKLGPKKKKSVKK
jgi:hypothetical protein